MIDIRQLQVRASVFLPCVRVLLHQAQVLDTLSPADFFYHVFYNATEREKTVTTKESQPVQRLFPCRRSQHTYICFV